MINRHTAQILPSLLMRRSPISISNAPPISISSFFSAFLSLRRPIVPIYDEIVRYLRADSVLFTRNARLAIYVFLQAIGVSKDDEVILSGFNCFVVPEVIFFLGAKPVYIDITASTSLDPDILRKKITDRTKCIIIPVHDGIDVDCEECLEIASENGIKVLVDGALTLPCYVNSNHVIEDPRVHGVIHSFGTTKMFSLMGGGVLLMSDTDIAASSKKILENYNRISVVADLGKIASLFLDRVFGRYMFLDLGVRVVRRLLFIEREILPCEYHRVRPKNFFRQMSRYKVLLLYLNMRHFDEWNDERRGHARIYRSRLKELPVRHLIVDEQKTAPLQYPVVMNESALGLYKYLIKHNIYVWRMFCPPLFPEGADLGVFGYDSADCPNAAALAEKIINLPLSPRLSSKDIHRICDLIVGYFERP